jgi:hypothetical protein
MGQETEIDPSCLYKSDCRPTGVFVPTGWHHSRHSAGCAGAHFTGSGLRSIPTVCTKEERGQVSCQGQSYNEASTDTVLDFYVRLTVHHELYV